MDISTTKKWNTLSAIVFLTLLIFAAIFWRERTWLLDIAFQTVLMLKDGMVQPFETLLLSASKGRQHTATLLIVPNSSDFNAALRQDTALFLSPFQHLPLHNLQGSYFQFATGAYLELGGN